MPSLTTAYEVVLDVTNDTGDLATVEVVREPGLIWSYGPVILLRPLEGLTLVLDAGSTYRYCFKTVNGKVANVKVRSWRDLTFGMRRIFPPAPRTLPLTTQPFEGVTVSYFHRDVRSCPPS